MILAAQRLPGFPTSSGKPGKMRAIFLVREIMGNSKIQPNIRKKNRNRNVLLSMQGFWGGLILQTEPSLD